MNKAPKCQLSSWRPKKEAEKQARKHVAYNSPTSAKHHNRNLLPKIGI